MKRPYEQPPTVTKKEERTDYVFEQFDNVGFEIKNNFPELFERVVELANMPDSHFDDAVKMSEIIEILWDEFKEKGDITATKEELKLACLFHDIGKSGPVEANREERMMIELIFNPRLFRVDSEKFQNSPQFKNKKPEEQEELIKSLSIQEVLEIENLPNKEEIIKYLKTLQLHIYDVKTRSVRIEKLDPQKHSMIELWR
jgi:hypothetical protein